MNIRLHPPTVWQHDRRNAIRILRTQRGVAVKQRRHDAADALLFALIDLEDTLRSRAAWLIEEGVEMRLAHLRITGLDAAA